MLAYGAPIDPESSGVKRVLDAAVRHALPLNVLCWGRIDLAATLARRFPDTQLVVDHLGLKQPFKPPVPETPFADLPKLLKLAAHDNVAVKITGACTLSRKPYPYDDIWEPLGRIFDAFGVGRCLWGTDWTRAVDLLTYAQGVEPFRRTDRLSEDERAALMGGSLQRIYKWAPG
jgi:predicted TIM-barrel fold metal-dependent hydrolase